MKIKSVGVKGVGFYVPDKILTNAGLEKMVDTSDEWIRTRTGIGQRRIAGKGIASSDLAAKAAKKAIRDAGITAKEIDLIIVATITPDMQFPATACIVQDKIGAKNSVCFDVSAACSGFIYAMSIGEKYIASGAYKNVLIIGAEVLSSIVDWSDRNTCVLFGDGAGAVILGVNTKNKIASTYLGSNGKFSELLKLPAGGSKMPASLKTVKNKMHYMKMKGNEVFKIAVRSMAESVEKVLQQSMLKIEDISYFIPHQANIRIINAVAKKLKLPLEKIHINLNKYGNMSSASVAVAFCEVFKNKKLKKGETIVLVAFGSGLAWGAMVIEWV